MKQIESRITLPAVSKSSEGVGHGWVEVQIVQFQLLHPLKTVECVLQTQTDSRKPRIQCKQSLILVKKLHKKIILPVYKNLVFLMLKEERNLQIFKKTYNILL